jgi:predicted nucleotide-binding protein (sugar kinase/HSP70/actin superfamily)
VRLTAPHMGRVDRILTDLFDRLGVEYMPPPATTSKTVTLGLKTSPEFACLPLKITVGNLIEGLDAGADATIMVGGCGPCRFGYYADIQRRIISSLGYEYDAVILEPPSQDFRAFLRTIKHIAPDASYKQIWDAFRWSFRKGQAYDRVDRRAIETRCYELERGATTAARLRACEVIDPARTPGDIVATEAAALAVIDAVPQDRTRDVLRIGLVGEFYLLLEPYVNFEIEQWLGERGVWLRRGCYLSDWIGPGEKNAVGGIPEEIIIEAAEPYLAHHVGGEGRATIGHTVLAAREGFDGMVHFLPFTCMPDTISKSLLPSVSAAEDIPTITFVVDEQTGRAGVHTRLEAFMDLLDSRRVQRRRRAVESEAASTAALTGAGTPAAAREAATATHEVTA